MPFSHEMRYCYCRNDHVMFQLQLSSDASDQAAGAEHECQAAPNCENYTCRWKTKSSDGHDCTIDEVQRKHSTHRAKHKMHT